MTSEEKAQRILEAARQVLTEQGYAATTISQIAAQAEVSRGLLHYYFKSKEDLLAQVVRAVGDDARQMIGMFFAQASDATELANAITEAIRHINQIAPDLFVIFFEGWSVGRHSPQVAHELETLFAEFRAGLRDALAGAMGRGVIRPTLPLDGLAATLTGLLDGLALQLVTDPDLAQHDPTWTTTEATIRHLLTT